MQEYYLENYSIDVRLDLVRSKLYELTESETDQELIDYNNYLLDTIDEAIGYIQQLEKRIPKKKYSSEEIHRLNRTYSTFNEELL